MQEARLFIVTLLLISSLTFAAFASGLKPEIIQIKDNRLYFDLGKESLIFPGADIYLIQSSDTTFVGDVEHSWIGVSVSEQINFSKQLYLTDSLELLVYPAVANSHTPLYISNSVTTDLIRLINSDSKRHILVTDYSDREGVWNAFESGQLDITITFNLDGAKRYSKNNVFTKSLLYIAVLLPNLNSVYNKNGYLTTSIYNRINTKFSSRYFDGDSVKSVMSFSRPDIIKVRPYPYDHKRGRDLFNNIRNRPSELSIYTSDKSLEKLANYISDVLSRDQCRVYSTDFENEADLLLYYVQVVENNPSVILYELYRILQSNSNTGNRHESLEIIGQHFKSIRFANSQDEYFNLLQLIESKMIEVLGVFPLFRPTLFITCQDDIIGEPFDEGGYIIGENIRKVILPKMGEDNK